MGGGLPDYIEPLRLAEARARLKGHIALAALPGLQAHLVSNEGVVEVDLQFGTDDDGVHFVSGEIAATLEMRCQRCMEPLPIKVRAATRLGIVASEAEAARLAKTYEPLIVSSEPTRFAKFVEDELVLNLPMTPKHGNGECQPHPPEGHAAVRQESPFAVLAILRRKDNST